MTVEEAIVVKHLSHTAERTEQPIQRTHNKIKNKEDRLQHDRGWSRTNFAN
jgi:hypothetical protein